MEDCEHFPPCGNAYRCRVRSVQWAPADERSYEVRKRDRKFTADSAAYRRMRAEGLQPKGVNESATLERVADHKMEVQLGRSISRRERNAWNREIGAVT